MKEWAIDVVVGAIAGYILVALTLGFFVDGSVFRVLLVLGMVVGVVMMRRRRQRGLVAQTP